jgi:hypothetical protein
MLSPSSHAENNIKGSYSQQKTQHITTQSQTIRWRIKIHSITSAFIYHEGDRKTFLTVGRIIKLFQRPTDAFTAILPTQNNEILYLISN